MNINHFHLDKVENFVGFSLNTAGEGEMVKVLSKAALTSDENDFYNFIEQISGAYFSKIGVIANNVSQFIILIHNDLSADIYINDIGLVIQIISKRAVKKGELITHKDIADINKLKFRDTELSDTDKVIFCGKVGWKFVLFFDLDRRKKINIEQMWITLGELYRYLSFQYIYKLLESETFFDKMVNDGWFPFIELIGGDEYKNLSNSYKHKRFYSVTIDKLISEFGKERIDKITNRWWNREIFNNKKIILMAGINAFLKANDEGYINCIKTLLPEIEGIIRLQYFSDTKKCDKVSIKMLLEYIVNKGKEKYGSDYSLLLPMQFLNYLNDIVFAQFDLAHGDVKLSRHSSSHGVAKPDDYTTVKALQMILILDQISFYI